MSVVKGAYTGIPCARSLIFNLREQWKRSRSHLVSPMWGSPGVGQNFRPFLSTDFSASERVWSDRFTTLSRSDKTLNSCVV